jgi:hypothetical protein
MRHHMTADGPVPFTPEEEAEWDAREAEELAAAPNREWAAIRAERNIKLRESDWTQVADAPVDAAAWADYRQALRDITLQDDPFNITWPSEPEA